MNSKIISLMATIVFVGCAAQQKPIVHNDEPQFLVESKSTTDDEGIPSAEALEQDTYDQSIDNINISLQEEYNEYRYCMIAMTDHSSCHKMLLNFCKVDVAIDSRYEKHFKPYCSRDYVKHQQ